MPLELFFKTWRKAAAAIHTHRDQLAAAAAATAAAPRSSEAAGSDDEGEGAQGSADHRTGKVSSGRTSASEPSTSPELEAALRFAASLDFVKPPSRSKEEGAGGSSSSARAGGGADRAAHMRWAPSKAPTRRATRVAGERRRSRMTAEGEQAAQEIPGAGEEGGESPDSSSDDDFWMRSVAWMAAGAVAASGAQAAAGAAVDAQCVAATALKAVRVHASLADYPAPPPWRARAPRGAVMRARGLQRPPAMRVAKLARNLRELEGSFMPRDSEGGAAFSVVGGAAFGVEEVSGALRAAVAAWPAAEKVWGVGGVGWCCGWGGGWGWEALAGIVRELEGSFMPRDSEGGCLVLLGLRRLGCVEEVAGALRAAVAAWPAAERAVWGLRSWLVGLGSNRSGRNRAQAVGGLGVGYTVERSEMGCSASSARIDFAAVTPSLTIDR